MSRACSQPPAPALWVTLSWPNQDYPVCAFLGREDFGFLGEGCAMWGRACQGLWWARLGFPLTVTEACLPIGESQGPP